jgi:hypothetical protein
LLANGESQVISIAYGGFFAKIFKVKSESTGFQHGRARIWFHFVERVTGNHIDEWQLNDGRVPGEDL